jgi:hypothetical protein
MPISANTPSEVAALLERARRQFVLGCADYDNFVDCIATAFKAIEALLHLCAGAGPGKRETLGPLITRSQREGLLTDHEFAYLNMFVRHFRNKLAHPKGPIAFTPGMSDEMLVGCHRFVAQFSDRHVSRFDRPCPPG